MIRFSRTPLISAAVAGAVFSTAGYSAAAVLTSQGFESTAGDAAYWTYTQTDSQYSNSGARSTSLGTDYPKVTGSTPYSRIRSGSYSFQSTTTTSSTTTPAFNGTQTTALTFDPVSLAGKTGASIELHLASFSLTSGNGADAAENVSIYVATDGQAFSSTPTLKIGGGANAQWGFTDIAANATAGQSKSLVVSGQGDHSKTDGYSTLHIAIPDGFNSVALKVVMQNDNTGEIWALDDVSISAVPEPGALAIVAMGGLFGLRRRRA